MLRLGGEVGLYFKFYYSYVGAQVTTNTTDGTIYPNHVMMLYVMIDKGEQLYDVSISIAHDLRTCTYLLLHSFLEYTSVA